LGVPPVQNRSVSRLELLLTAMDEVLDKEKLVNVLALRPPWTLG
jgi:hypothetical protein